MVEEQLIEIKGLCKSFTGIKALDQVDVTINKGEIHCLAGENGSGKSTLIKCLSGVQSFDDGEVYLHGSLYRHISTKDAMKAGIIVIYQDLSLFPNLTVAENIAFNHMIEYSSKIVSQASNKEIAKKELSHLGYDIDCDELVENLSVAEKQIVAIARAMSLEARLIVMDEPTTALTKKEVDRLLVIVQELKDKGLSIIFVSHKLDEVFEIADNITVLRDGKKVGDFIASELDAKKLSFYMTGREVDYITYKYEEQDQTVPLLEVKNLTRKDMYEDINLQMYPGEIVGITGLLGSGRTELALSLFGLNPPDFGEIYMNGKKVDIRSPKTAIKHGIGLLPEDRHIQGLFNNQSIAFNIISTVLNGITKKNTSVIDNTKMMWTVEKWFESLKIKAVSVNNPPISLSGGNQQRVVLAKWLAINPKLLILDSPTVGIDVGSKSEIHEIIHNLARDGMCIIIISDEIGEVFHNSNKIAVMKDGRIISVKHAGQTSEDELKNLVNGGSL